MSLKHPSLTEYVLKLLAKHKIINLNQFIRKDNSKLSEIINLSTDEIVFIKKSLTETVRGVNGLDYLRFLQENAKTYKTGIESLDDLMGGGLSTGSIIEICGLTASGKTQICRTIVQNVLHSTDVECFWIDSRFKFSSNCLVSNLQAKQLSTQKIGDVLEKIKVERIFNVPKLIEALEELVANIRIQPKFKILIIDSIAAIMLQLQNEKPQSRSLLTKIAGLLRKIAVEHQTIIVTTNYVYDSMGQQSPVLAMGQVWRHVPTHRLLLRKINSTEICIKLIKSCNLRTKMNCRVNITEKGIL